MSTMSSLDTDALIPLAGVVFVILMVRAFSPQIYDIIILSMTKVWYLCTFDKIAKTQKKGKDRTPSPFRLLDVGIGTASAAATLNKNRVMAQNVSALEWTTIART